MASTALQIVISEQARGLIAEAAQEAGCKSSTWARQKLYEALRASGRDPVAVPKSGTTTPGVMQWAIVEGDSVRSFGGAERVSTVADKHMAEPLPAGQRWLPVEYEDSEPFDPAKHYRLTPLPPRVDGDRVVRVYPVVAKEDVE